MLVFLSTSFYVAYTLRGIDVDRNLSCFFLQLGAFIVIASEEEERKKAAEEPTE